jgi:hypothetical protein
MKILGDMGRGNNLSQVNDKSTTTLEANVKQVMSVVHLPLERI